MTPGVEAADLRSQVEDLKAAVRRREDLLRMMAHDLRTPLMALSLQVEMLDGAESQRHRAARILRRNVKRLSLMLDDFLDLARLDTATLALRCRPLDLGDIVSDAAEPFGAQAKEAGVTFAVQSPAGIVVDGDERRLHQVMANVLSNAIRYTPRGGEVSVRARTSRGMAEVEVRDTGQGMDAAQRARLFQPFSNCAESPVGSSGLGLYLAQAVVQGHGGSIEIESAGPDRGTTATVRIPLRTARAEFASA